jgi:hypothetical protein
VAFATQIAAIRFETLRINELAMEYAQDYHQGGEENDDGEQDALARSMI